MCILEKQNHNCHSQLLFKNVRFFLEKKHKKINDLNFERLKKCLKPLSHPYEYSCKLISISQYGCSLSVSEDVVK